MRWPNAVLNLGGVWEVGQSCVASNVAAAIPALAKLPLEPVLFFGF